MALKKLITFLVLLWTMHHYRANRIIKAKYRETRVVNYKQDNDDNDDFSTHRLVNFLTVMSIEWTMI